MKKIISIFNANGYGFYEEIHSGKHYIVVYKPTTDNNLGELVVSQFEFSVDSFWLDFKILMSWLFNYC